MTVALPWVLWSAVAAALAVFVSHLLSVRRPPVLMLPTTRFLPPRTVRAVSLSTRPTDVLLLLLRMLAVLSAGLAFAGVQWAGARAPVVQILAIDATAVSDDSLAWSTAIDRALQASPFAAVVRSDGQVIINPMMQTGSDSVTVLPSRRGSLASALLAARRAAPEIASSADSIALTVVSPLRADASTSVLDTVRAMWPGRITLIRVPTQEAGDPSSPASATVNALADEAAVTRDASPGASSAGAAERAPRVVVRSVMQDDVVAAAFARWSMLAAPLARIVRDSVTEDDTRFAEGGGALVVWKDVRGDPDTTQLPAVIANGQALVSQGMVPIVASTTGESRTIVWWPDGSAAAAERDLGAGCVREVLFTAPTNDALLQPSARGVLSALSAPCGVAGSMGTRLALNETQLTMLRGDGPLAVAAAFEVPPPENRYARWLLLAAFTCLIAELLLRRRSTVMAE